MLSNWAVYASICQSLVIVCSWMILLFVHSTLSVILDRLDTSISGLSSCTKHDMSWDWTSGRSLTSAVCEWAWTVYLHTIILCWVAVFKWVVKSFTQSVGSPRLLLSDLFRLCSGRLFFGHIPSEFCTCCILGYVQYVSMTLKNCFRPRFVRGVVSF